MAQKIFSEMKNNTVSLHECVTFTSLYILCYHRAKVTAVAKLLKHICKLMSHNNCYCDLQVLLDRAKVTAVAKLLNTIHIRKLM